MKIAYKGPTTTDLRDSPSRQTATRYLGSVFVTKLTWRRTMRRFTFLALAGILTLGLALNVQASNKGIQYTFGDVFVSVGNGQVVEFTPTGSVVQTLNDGSGSAFTTGSAFDSAGNLYVTN